MTCFCWDQALKIKSHLFSQCDMSFIPNCNAIWFPIWGENTNVRRVSQQNKILEKTENSFLWETSLHGRNHTGEQPFQCSQCDMASQEKKLTVHIRTHNGMIPYQFNQFDMAITHQASLTVHLRTHTG